MMDFAKDTIVLATLSAEGGSCTYERLFEVAEEHHCDVLAAAVLSLKKAKKISYDGMMLLMPGHKDVVIAIAGAASSAAAETRAATAARKKQEEQEARAEASRLKAEQQAKAKAEQEAKAKAEQQAREAAEAREAEARRQAQVIPRPKPESRFSGPAHSGCSERVGRLRLMLKLRRPLPKPRRKRRSGCGLRQSGRPKPSRRPPRLLRVRTRRRRERRPRFPARSARTHA